MKRKHCLRRMLPAGALLVLVCILAWIGAGIYQNQFVTFQEQRYRKDSASLNMRDTELTVEEYQELCALLPTCSIQWLVPIQNQRVEPEVKTLVLTAPTEEDLERLTYLPRLEELEVLDCQDPEAMLTIQEQHPDLELRYQVSVQGKLVDNHVQSLTLTDGDPAELIEVMPYLERLETVHFTGTLPPLEALGELEQAFPELNVNWDVLLGGKKWNRDTTELDLTGGSVSLRELCDALAYLPKVEWVNVSDTILTDEEYRSLADQFPEIRFWGGWITLLGQEVSTEVEELDLSDIPLTDTKEIEAALPYLRDLKKVDMCRCGLSNEEMDALNQRYEDIRFVWEVRICTRRFRTDATGFIVAMVDAKIVNGAKDEEVGQLRYCTDMIAVDIGHMSSVTNCEWAAYMPNLQYLIMGESRVSDLTPLVGLKNLVWLEIFDIPVTDLSPLTQITSLEDLNLSGITCDPEPITHMTWLKNLWWFGVAGRPHIPAGIAPEILPEALPDTKVVFQVAHATAGGWRKLPNYYKMRDALGMGYMD